MPTRIELLKQAGFSDAEIGDWATAERPRMHDAGFSDDEIDEEFGVTRPPREAPAAYIERLKQGNALQRIAGAAGDYAQQYFGDEPLGFSPRNQDFLRRLGVVGDIAIPAAKPVDAVLRAVPAGIAAVGAGFGQAVEEAGDAAFGPGPEAKGKAARDYAQLAQIAALVAGASRSGAGTAPMRAPVSRAAGEPAIMLPRAEDFRNAAAAISGTPSSFRTEQKLLQLWKDHGIPPAEVAQDAMRDRSIAADVASDSEKLPGVYVGTGADAATRGEHGAPAQPAGPAQGDRSAASVESQPGTAAEDGASLGQSGPEPAPMVAESKDIALYAPPRIPQRPFKFDYRTPPPAMADGRIRFDMEGRPLDAQFVAGRRFVGEGDRPLSSDDIKAALTPLDLRLIEMPILPGQHESVVGLYRGGRSRHIPHGDIFIKSTMSAEDKNLTTAHEFGHAIDHFSDLMFKRLLPEEIDELRKLYTTLRVGPRKTPFPQPEDFGYDQRSVPRELLAEGLRAYLMNPNYFKAVAPRTAATIRAEVNDNPYLKHIIQFNSLGAAGLIGAGLGNRNQDDQ